jgi:hypothetical protein
MYGYQIIHMLLDTLHLNKDLASTFGSDDYVTGPYENVNPLNWIQ